MLAPPAPGIDGVEANNLNNRSDEAYNVRLFGSDSFELLEPRETPEFGDIDESVEFAEPEKIPQCADETSSFSELEIMILYGKETLVDPDSDLSNLGDSMDSREIEEYWHVDKNDVPKYSEPEETVDTGEFFEAEDTTGYVDVNGTTQYPELEETVDDEDYFDADEATSYVDAVDDDYEDVDEPEDTNGYRNGTAETTEYVDANGTESHQEDFVDTERYAVTEDVAGYVVDDNHVDESDDNNGCVEGTVGNTEHPNANGAELYHEIEEVVDTEECLGIDKNFNNEIYAKLINLSTLVTMIQLTT